jgi:hypothetical protein
VPASTDSTTVIAVVTMLRPIAWATSGLLRFASSWAGVIRSSSASSGNSKNTSIGRLAISSQATWRRLGRSVCGVANGCARVNRVSAIVVVYRQRVATG